MALLGQIVFPFRSPRLIPDATSWMVAHQGHLSMEFSRQEYRSELPFPPPGYLPDPGIKPTLPVSLVLQEDSLPLSHVEALPFL